MRVEAQAATIVHPGAACVWASSALPSQYRDSTSPPLPVRSPYLSCVMSNEPGSASSVDEAYSGSRQEKFRFEYPETVRGGFCELHPMFAPSGEEFFQWLKAVGGVTRVRWLASKSSQGEASTGRYMQNNILVTKKERVEASLRVRVDEEPAPGARTRDALYGDGLF